MALWTTLLLLAAAPGDRPAARRLRELVARSPALSDPASFVHSPHAAHGARAVASRPHAGSSRGRALHDTCDMPFQIVEEGERCTEPNAGVAVLECKEPLKCIYGRCKKVKEGDHCTTDAQCDGTGSNIDLVCVKGKCGHLLEAGETCTDDAQCFSNKCGTTGVCSGLKQGEKCEYLGGGDNVLSYQNPCDKGLHCAVKNSEEGEQLATCEPPVSTGGVCFGYTIRTDAIAPDWFYPAYVSAVYAACDAGHVCELVKFHPNGENGQPDAGLWQYHGLCRRLLATPPGETCHSDSVCAPPYACIHSKCTSTELTCGDAALIIDPMDTDAHAVALLHGCATNERCSCPGGVGHCYAIHDECTAEEARLVKCMEQHKCPWVDFGQTQCADDACEDEQIAYECCKYRAPQFSANVDWAVRARAPARPPCRAVPRPPARRSRSPAAPACHARHARPPAVPSCRAVAPGAGDEVRVRHGCARELRAHRHGHGARPQARRARDPRAQPRGRPDGEQGRCAPCSCAARAPPPRRAATPPLAPRAATRPHRFTLPSLRAVAQDPLSSPSTRCTTWTRTT